MTDGTGTTNYGYNRAGWLTSNTDGTGHSVTDGYDLDGDVTAITYPNLDTVTRDYTNDDQLSKVTDWNNKSTSFTYDPDGDLSTTTYPNGISTATSYDTDDTLTALTYNDAGSALAGYTVDPDPAENTLSVTTAGSLAGTPGTYTYNPLNQISSYANPDPVGSYSYDDVGNLLTQANGTTQTYDPASQLASASTAAGITTNYAFDPRGDRTTATPSTGPTQTYSYDQASQLTGYTNGDTTASYTYNGDGLRTAKTVGSTTNTYSWDQTTNSTPLMLCDGSSNYIYGPDGTPVEQIDSDGTTTTYLLTDPQGSTRLLTNATGTVTGSYNYDPNGNTLSHTGDGSPLRYTGQYQDDETGLYYLQARYYDPTTAQFLTRDPLEAETGQPYSYAGDDPIDNSDPSGAFCVGSVCTGFHPMAGLDALVNIGRGASFGLTDKFDNWVSPGSSCTVAQNGLDQALGGAATSLALAGGATGLARIAALRLPYTTVDGLIETEEALGLTDGSGNIFVDSSLEGQELRQTLLHEALHSVYVRLAPGLAASTYDTAAGKLLEEFLAESFATGNPIGAFRLAITY